MLMINLEFKAPATNVVRDVFIVLSNIETAALFLACFVLGKLSNYLAQIGIYPRNKNPKTTFDQTRAFLQVLPGDTSSRFSFG